MTASDRLAELERQAAAKSAAEAPARIAALDIPGRALDVIRAGAKVTTAVSELDACADKPIVVLSGNPGSGKTIAAARWLYEAQAGLFVKAARLSRWERYDVAQMNLLIRAARLVIDDLGTEFQDVKGNFMAILDEVIDVRYDESRPTVITTNLDAKGFKAKYGARIADRIREAGRFVSIGADSMRGAK